VRVGNHRKALDTIYDLAGKYCETRDYLENLSLSVKISDAYELLQSVLDGYSELEQECERLKDRIESR
jgi:hypothetical protein